MSTIEICLAQESDAKELLTLYAPCVQNSAVTFEYEVPSVSEFVMRIRTISLQYPYLVCRQDGKVIGCAYAFRFRDRAAFQWNVELFVTVAEEARRQGIGTALYRCLLELLRLQNVQNVYAFVTLPNPAGEALNRCCGFELVGTYQKTGYKFGYWHDVSVYQKHLGDTAAEPEPTLPVEVLATSKIQEILSAYSTSCSKS